MITSWQGWVHRRVERVEFIDAESFRRSESVDFTIPDWLPGPPDIVPLTLIRKTEVVEGERDRTIPLKSLSVRDDQGRALRVLASDENRRIGFMMLYLLAQDVLDRAELGSIHDELWPKLRDMIDGDLRRGGGAYREFIAPRKEAPELGSQRNALAADLQWSDLARTLAEGYLLHILLPGASIGTPHLVKFTHLQSWRPARLRLRRAFLPRHLVQRVGYVFGFVGFPIRLLAASAAFTRAYHVEIVSPPELLLAEAALQVGRQNEDRRRWVGVAHLYGSRLASEDIGIRLEFALRPQGIVSWAVFGSWILALMLAAGLYFHYSGAATPRAEASAAVVLVIPALVGVLLAGQAEHQLARRLFAVAKYQMAILTLVSLAAAGTLSIETHAGPATEWYWAALLIVTLISAVIASTTFLYPAYRLRSRRRKI
jgi:hypothetical protein